MWNGQGNVIAPGQMMRNVLAGSGISMPNVDMRDRYAGIGPENEYNDDMPKKCKSEVIDANNGIVNAHSSRGAGNQVHSFGHMANLTNSNHGYHEPTARSILTDGVLTNQTSQFLPSNSASQCGAYSAHCESTHIMDVNLQKAAIENSNPHIRHIEPSPISTAAVIEIPRLPYSQHFTYNVARQVDSGNLQSVSHDNISYKGNDQANHNSRDERSTQQESQFLDNNPSFHAVNMTHGTLTTLGYSQPGVVGNEVPFQQSNPDKINYTLDSNSTSVAEYAHSNEIVNVAGRRNVVSYSSSSVVGAVVREETFGSSQSEIGSTHDKTDHSLSAVGEVTMKSGEIDNALARTFELKNSQMLNDLITGSFIGLKEETLHKMVDGSSNISGPHENLQSSRLSGESKELTGNLASTISAKLWDGTLQLNTSTTVSAVAFFKSGEKMLEINWPHYVEVKGKVRLEAFEKFIQELPRSRSRALMVISLCWKVGSSESGLTGIKEVAKAYKEGQRVGFAQLSPGIDLYVCPRSDTIITILAKYGFFKGMAAVEEDQNSLIGCVVWRRNHISSNDVSKDFDPKKHPSGKSPIFPCEPRLQNAELNSTTTNAQESEKNLGLTHGGESTGVPAHLPVQSSSLENSRTTQQTNITHFTMNSPTTGAPNSSLTTAATPVTHGTLPVVSSQQPPAQSISLTSPQIFVESLSCTVAPIVSPEVPNQLNMDFNDNPAFRKVLELLQSSQKRNKRVEDDDLPEFDFNTAYGGLQASDSGIILFNRQPNNATSAPQCLKQHHVEQSNNSSRAIASSSEEKSLASQYSVSPLTIYQGSKQATDVGNLTSGRWPAAPTLATTGQIVSHIENRGPDCQGANLNSSTKKIWDDDDDMPEWCPPDMDHKQPPPPPLPPGPPPLRSYPKHHPDLDKGCQSCPPPLPPPQSLPHHTPELDHGNQLLRPPPLPTQLLSQHPPDLLHGYHSLRTPRPGHPPPQSLPQRPSDMDHGHQLLSPPPPPPRSLPWHSPDLDHGHKLLPPSRPPPQSSAQRPPNLDHGHKTLPPPPPQLLAQRPILDHGQKSLAPPPPPLQPLSRRPSGSDQGLGLLPEAPPLLPLPAAAPRPMLPSTTHDPAPEVTTWWPSLPCNAADHTRGIRGPGSTIGNFQSKDSKQRHSSGPNFNSTSTHRFTGFDAKTDKRSYSGPQYIEMSKRQHVGFDAKSDRQRPSSPGGRSNEMPRRRNTGFDVLPDHSRSSPEFSPTQHSRRRPSLFDVKPGGSR